MSKRNTIYVLNVDQDTRDLISRLADSLDHQVECFSDPHQLIRAAKSGHGCVITELEASSTLGIDVQGLLTENYVALRVIFVAAAPTIPAVVRVMRDGAVTVLQKPVQETQLHSALQEALAIDSRVLQQKIKRADCQRRLASLSSNEREVLQMVYEGLSNKDIAKILEVSIRTVELRRHTILKRLHVKSVVEAVRLVVVATECKTDPWGD